MRGEKLWVVMPVYNEQKSVALVLDEWIPALRESVGSFTILAINDGSSDNTAGILEAYAAHCPEMMILHQANGGHGKSCIDGYRMAIGGGAQWILQIDSDGQCDPRFFPALWAAREKAAVVYGYRYQRQDGYGRTFVSRTVSLFTWAATGVWVRDANVPYRLMHRESLLEILPLVPPTVHLANILVSVLLQQKHGIKWIPIVFRTRIGGTPSAKNHLFVSRGIELYRQLRQARNQSDWGKTFRRGV